MVRSEKIIYHYFKKNILHDAILSTKMFEQENFRRFLTVQKFILSRFSLQRGINKLLRLKQHKPF